MFSSDSTRHAGRYVSATLVVAVGVALCTGVGSAEAIPKGCSGPDDTYLPYSKVKTGEYVSCARWYSSSTGKSTKGKTSTKSKPTTKGDSGSSGVGILDKIAKCESGGNYKAKNPKSTASGKYQFLDSTWANYKGYKHAKDAPASVQEERALIEYKKNGTRPWNASKSCWG